MSISRLPVAILAACCAAGLLVGEVRADTKPNKKTEFVVAVYGVADLVIPLDPPAKDGKTTEKTLMKVLRALVDPASWEEQSGEANVQFYPLGHGLVVRQTAENQETVAKVLADLRQVKHEQLISDLGVPIGSGNFNFLAEHVVAIYGVADLVVSPDAPAKDGKMTEEALMHLVISEVSPSSWADVGGKGTLQFYPTGRSLVVWQTPEYQEMVGKTLAKLRGTQNDKALDCCCKHECPAIAAKQYYVGELLIIGNELTRDRIILEMLDGIYCGNPLDPAALKKAEQRLARSGLFDLQDPPTVTTIERDDEFNSVYKEIQIKVKDSKSISASIARLMWGLKETTDGIRELTVHFSQMAIDRFQKDLAGVNDAIAKAKLPADETAKQVLRTYPIVDLIIPIPNAKSKQIELANARWQKALNDHLKAGNYNTPVPYACPAAPTPPRPDPETQTLETELIQLITKAIDPTSWSDVGGRGTIQYYPLANSLVVNQTQENHERISDLLQAFRRLQDVEVTVETRLVTIASPAADYFKTFLGFHENLQSPVILSDCQVACFLEAVQGDRSTNVMQAPKITVFNGQAANINVGDEVEIIGIDMEKVNGQPIQMQHQARMANGVFMTTTPVVSADRKNVRSHFSFMTTAVNEKSTGKPSVESLTLEKFVDLPDGKTALFHVGKITKESRKEIKTPFLWRLPVVGEHFKQVSYEPEERDVFLLLTTRVIVNEQEEPEFRCESLPRIPR